MRALTGLNRKAFDELLSTFNAVYEQSLLQQRRQRAMGGGRTRLHKAQDNLFYILLYFKCYPTFDLAGLLFDIDRVQAHHWMHRLQSILETALGQLIALLERAPQQY